MRSPSSLLILLITTIFFMTGGNAFADHLNGRYQGIVDGDGVDLQLEQRNNQLNGKLVSQSGENLSLNGEVDAEGNGLLSIKGAKPQWENIKLMVQLKGEDNLQLYFLQVEPFFDTLVPISQANLTRQTHVSTHKHANTTKSQTSETIQPIRSSSVGAKGQQIKTKGVIASMNAPKNWQYKYDSAGDVIVLHSSDKHAITIATTLASNNLAKELGDLLNQSQSGNVRTGRIAGYEAAYVSMNKQGAGQIFATMLNKDGLGIFMLVVSKDNIEEAKSHLAPVLASMRYARLEHPGVIAGSYVERHGYSDNYGSDPVGIGSESRLIFNRDGSLESSWRMAGGNSASYLNGQQESVGGVWEIRGTRILYRRPGGSNVKFRFSNVNEGIALYDPKGEVSYLLRR